MSVYPADRGSRTRGAAHLFREIAARPASALGAALVLVFLFLAIFGPFLAPYGENQQIEGAESLPPSTQYWFGTDHLGRDVALDKLLGKHNVMLLFYPLDFTPT